VSELCTLCYCYCFGRATQLLLLPLCPPASGFCKQQLWPLFHYILPGSPSSSQRFNVEYWQAYVKANKVTGGVGEEGHGKATPVLQEKALSPDSVCAYRAWRVVRRRTTYSGARKSMCARFCACVRDGALCSSGLRRCWNNYFVHVNPEMRCPAVCQSVGWLPCQPLCTSVHDSLRPS